MVTKRLTMRAVAGLTLWAGFGSAAQAQLPEVTPEQAFKVQPRQKGVNVSTPTPDQVGRCTVAPIPNPKDPKSPMGYVVRDPAGKAVRQFVSYDGKSFNIIAFYLDGAEAYREVYPPQPGEAYQFRWFGPNGTRWGLDKDRDGRIDEWVVISPEELSQELLQAVLNRDAKRVEALTLTKTNLDTIGLQGPDAQKLLDRAAGAAARTNKAGEELKASATSEWLHLELGVPQAVPGDALGIRDDLVSYKSGTVLLKDGMNSKSLQMGEIVQIGRAWKIVDGPSVGVVAELAGPGIIFPGIEGFVAELDKLDQAGPENGTIQGLAAHNARRAAILEKIYAKLPGDISDKVRETWTKQLIDSLSAASEVEKLDGRHLARLKQFKDAFGGQQSPLGAYIWFHYLLTENSISLRDAEAGKLASLQEKWRTSLEEFIKAHPKAEETPEATLRLGMAFEFMSTKEGDTKAKEWYETLARNHAGHPHAAKAAGAVKRLASEGQLLEVSGPNLATGQPFDVASLKGKVVVVYYFASWSSTLPEDAKRLKSLVKDYGPKGLELIGVCLDNDAKQAAQTVATHGLPGTILHAAGGLDGSPLAAQYGIIVVPHLFVAGKDGKILNRNAQVANLEDEAKKLLP